MLRLSASAALLATSLAGTLDAQVGTLLDPRVIPGAEVRVQASHSRTRREASLLSLRGDTILLDVRHPHEQIAILLADVQGFEVRVDHGNHKRAGILLGLIVGGAGGAVIGRATYSGPKTDGYNSGLNSIAYGLGGGVLGAIAGGVIGRHMPRNRWVRISLPLRPAST